MPASRPTDTRQSLLDEGVRALLELTPELLISAVGAKEIARRCGIKVSTLYYHFGSLSEYAEAVAAQVFDPAEFGVEAVLDGVGEVRESEFPVEIGRAMHRSEFLRVRDDPELRVRLGLWALGGPSMDRAYGDMLRMVDARIAASSEAIFAGWGREPSPPFDAPAFIAAHSALLSGSVVRHLVDPDGISIETFARTAQALSMVMLRVQGDRRTLDDRLTEINYYPLRHRTFAPLSEGRARTRDRVLQAAAEHFASETYDQITVANIARSADASPSTVYGLFDGVDDIAVQLLLAQGEKALADAAWSALPGLEAVTERLSWVADQLAARSRYIAPYTARLATSSTPPGDVLLGTITEALAACRDGGALRSGLRAERVAQSLLVLTVASLHADPASGPASAVREATQLVFPGLVAPAP